MLGLYRELYRGLTVPSRGVCSVRTFRTAKHLLATLAQVQDTCKKWSQEPQIPFCNSVLAHYGRIAACTPRRRCRWKFAGVSGKWSRRCVPERHEFSMR